MLVFLEKVRITFYKLTLSFTVLHYVECVNVEIFNKFDLRDFWATKSSPARTNDNGKRLETEQTLWRWRCAVVCSHCKWKQPSTLLNIRQNANLICVQIRIKYRQLSKFALFPQKLKHLKIVLRTFCKQNSKLEKGFSKIWKIRRAIFQIFGNSKIGSHFKWMNPLSYILVSCAIRPTLTNKIYPFHLYYSTSGVK